MSKTQQVEISVEKCPQLPEESLHKEKDLEEAQESPKPSESGLLENPGQEDAGDPSYDSDAYLGEPPEIELVDGMSYAESQETTCYIPNLCDLDMVDEIGDQDVDLKPDPTQ